MPLRSSKRGKYWEIWPRRDCRAGWSAHLHLSSATAPGLRAELLPLGSHGRSPRQTGAAGSRQPTRWHQSPATARHRHREDIAGPCEHLPCSGIAVPVGTWHPPGIPSGYPGTQRSFQSLWTSQSLADIPYTQQTSWYPAGILGTCRASLYPVGIPST